MLNRRRVMGGKKGLLPAGYTQVEYIESTGTQYIDTGISGTSITRFIVKGTCVVNGGSNTQLIGGIDNSSTTFFGARILSGVISWYCTTEGGYSIGNPSNLSTIDCTINSTTIQPGTLIDYVEDTTSNFIRLGSVGWGFTSTDLLLFGGNENRVSPNATCYGLRLYTSEGLIRDLIPVKRDSDQEIGMYDLVYNTFFTNSGTDSFIAGPEV